MAFAAFLFVLIAQALVNVSNPSFIIMQQEISVHTFSTIFDVSEFVFSLISAGLWSLMALSSKQERIEKVPNIAK